MCRPTSAWQFEPQASLHWHLGIANHSASSGDEDCQYQILQRYYKRPLDVSWHMCRGLLCQNSSLTS